MFGKLRIEFQVQVARTPFEQRGVRMRKMIAMVVLAGCAAGCATVTRGTNTQVQFLSNPPEALARTSTGYSCTTPCQIQVTRKDEFVVTVSKPGYHSEEVAVRTHVADTGAVGFVGNVLIGGVVGAGVDVATGATLEHVPNPVSVTLQPLRRGEAPRTNRHGPPMAAPSPPIAPQDPASEPSPRT
jgi:hypothetical protein